MRPPAKCVHDEAAHSGVLRHLYMRRGEKSGEMVVCVVINGAALHEEALLVELLRAAVPELTGVLLNINREKTNVVLGKNSRTLWGKAAITDTLCGLEFEIAPHAFYQVNRTQAERLYGKAAEYAALTGSETLLDLYCGTGTIGLSMAKDAKKKIIGAEIVPAAVEMRGATPSATPSKTRNSSAPMRPRLQRSCSSAAKSRTSS